MNVSIKINTLHKEVYLSLQICKILVSNINVQIHKYIHECKLKDYHKLIKNHLRFLEWGSFSSNSYTSLDPALSLQFRLKIKVVRLFWEISLTHEIYKELIETFWNFLETLLNFLNLRFHIQLSQKLSEFQLHFSIFQWLLFQWKSLNGEIHSWIIYKI